MKFDASTPYIKIWYHHPISSNTIVVYRELGFKLLPTLFKPYFKFYLTPFPLLSTPTHQSAVFSFEKYLETSIKHSFLTTLACLNCIIIIIIIKSHVSRFLPLIHFKCVACYQLACSECVLKKKEGIKKPNYRPRPGCSQGLLASTQK